MLFLLRSSWCPVVVQHQRTRWLSKVQTCQYLDPSLRLRLIISSRSLAICQVIKTVLQRLFTVTCLRIMPILPGDRRAGQVDSYRQAMDYDEGRPRFSPFYALSDSQYSRSHSHRGRDAPPSISQIDEIYKAHKEGRESNAPALYLSDAQQRR